MARRPYLALVFLLLGATAAAADTCSDLAMNPSLATLPNTTITSAATVSGTFTPPNGGMPIEGLPSFCRVTATLKPSAASDIKIEIWMPSSGWNGKFEGVGNGGLGAQGEAAGQRRPEPQKAAPPHRLRRAGEIRENSLAAQRVRPHVFFPSRPHRRIISCFFQPVSTFANLVNAKERPER